MFGATTVGQSPVNLQNKGNYGAPSTPKSPISTKPLPSILPTKPAAVPSTILSQVTAAGKLSEIPAQQKTTGVGGPKIPTTLFVNPKAEEEKVQAKVQEQITRSNLETWPKLGSAQPNSIIEEQLKKALDTNGLDEKNIVALAKYYASIGEDKQASKTLGSGCNRARDAANPALLASLCSHFGDYELLVARLSEDIIAYNAAACKYALAAQIDVSKSHHFISRADSIAEEGRRVLEIIKKDPTKAAQYRNYLLQLKAQKEQK